jgi:hypothetical protein
MKQIIGNKYIKVFKFASSKEVSTFLSNQGTENCLSIENLYSDIYYCYVCYSSLTREKQFVLCFSSDESEDNLNFLFWDEQRVFVLDTGKNIYLIDENLNIKKSFEITTPLIGLHLINKNNLLLLEEAFMRVVDYNGKILRSELFDLIDDFSIKDNILSIRTYDEGNKVFDLAPRSAKSE